MAANVENPSLEAGRRVLAIRGSLDEVNACFYERGWTDGLPVVPPTRERVEGLLAGWPGEPDEEIAEVPPLMGVATVRAVAVNAVMAGCAPEYMPVVVAALSAVTKPRYGLSHRQTTTHPATALIIVNGPIAKRLRINSGSGLFGPGWRANATIGRALRLCLINLGGAVPGEVDRAQHAHPGKYSYCIAENEDANPWEPYHVERGFAPDESTVTLTCGEAPHCITDNYNTEPHALLFGYADSMATLGGNNLSSQGEPVLVMAPEHAAYIAQAGWSKADVKRYLFEKARKPWKHVGVRGKSKGPAFPVWVDRTDPEASVPILTRADALILITGGGEGQKSMWIPTPGAQTLSVIEKIRE
ncbi:MAG: hypothetical protein OXG62_06180 [Nitrospinae bacterium]|nr:hypothetical protein [Nitrospinota bacterium]